MSKGCLYPSFPCITYTIICLYIYKWNECKTFAYSFPDKTNTNIYSFPNSNRLYSNNEYIRYEYTAVVPTIQVELQGYFDEP